jgi:hypothetical protein
MENGTVGAPERSVDDPAWRFAAIDIDPVFKRIACPPHRDEHRQGKHRCRLGFDIGSLPAWVRSLRPESGLAVFLWALFLTVVLWVGASAIDGNLANSSGSQDNLRPALHSLVTSVPGFITPHLPAKTESFPFLADSAAWLFAIASAITLGLLLRQWRIMAEVVPRLIERGAIQVKDETGFLKLIGCLNRIMGSKWTTAVIAAVAAGITALIYNGLSESGLYETLAPNGGHPQHWARAAYEHWWAAARPGAYLGFLMFALVLFIYLYYLLAQYVAGAVWVALTKLGSEHVDFSFDCSNMDGFFGWRPLRDLMVTVYLSILTQVLALLPLLHLLTRGSWVYLAVPFGLFLVFNPIYVLTPLLLVSPELRERREQFLKELAERDTIDPYAPAEGRFEEHAQRAKAYEFVRSMPVFPIRGRELAFGFATYVLPIAAILWHG